MTDLESSLEKASDTEDDDDVVVFGKGSDYESRIDDVPPLNLTMVSNQGRFSRYKRAMKQLQPVKIFTGHEAARIDQAGCLSFITYSWIFPYLWSTYRGLIPSDQQWTCSTYDSSAVNVTRSEYLWTNEKRSFQNRKGPSLIKVVLKFMQTRLLLACFVFLFCLLFGFIGPSCLVRSLIIYTETTSANKDLSRGISLVIGISVVELLRVLSYGATWAVSYRTAIRVRSAVLGLLYKKLLVARGLSSKGIGNIVNNFSNDGQRIFDAVTFMPLVIMGPLVLVGGLAYLLWLMGPWSLLGLAVFVVFDIIQYSLGKTMVRYRKLAIEKSNLRVKFITEIIQCIKTIKMNAWEYAFIDKVCDVRKEEKKYLANAGYAQSLAIAAGPVVPVVAAAITFSAYILAGNHLDASTAFSAITVFFVMVFGIRMIPYGMRYCAEASVSIKTIQVTHLMDQLPDLQDKKSAKDTELQLLAVDEATATHAVLKNVNVKLKKKQLIGVCGAVGSGKSSLLQAICGEMIQKHGTVQVGGTIAYAAQDPWILNTTFRENVLFGETFDNHRYYRVIFACNLNPDINVMPAGDQTEVGERGTTLSGGQKARLALARVLYSNRDIYLLDDFFSSLDVAVSRHVFDYAIRGLLVDKSVLLVTNNLQYLEMCNEIIFMKGGRTIDHGRHEDVLLRCDEYAVFCDTSAKRYTPKQIEIILNPAEGLLPPQTDDTVVRSQSEVELAERKAEAKLRSDTALSSSESVYDIPSAVSGQIIEAEEDFGLSAVSKDIYKTYILSLGGYCTLTVVLLSFALNVASTLFSTVWLAKWLKSMRHADMNSTGNITDVVLNATDNQLTYYASVYYCSILLLILTSMFKALLFVKVTLNASNKLHNNTFHRVMHATMTWFDLTPLGRIVNRFSKDVDELDVKIPFSAETFVQNILLIAGYLLLISSVFPWFLVACVPLGALFFVFVACFRSGIRCLKRAENISRSPMFSHIECSLRGAATIRSFGRVKYFTEKFKHLLDNNSGAMFMYQSAMRWLAVWLDMLVVMVTFCTSLLIILLSDRVEPAYAGMAIAFAIQMSGIFQFAVRMHAELESKLTAVERLDYYIKNIDQDPDWYNVRRPITFDWPQHGRLSFRDVHLKYRDNIPPALKGISFDAKAEEKIGIIGRTGSGKSSIGAALFRLYPLTNGSICIDGVDVQPLGLHELRQKMAAIPQDPILFAGTVRFNLDPLRKHDELSLWNALEKTKLKPLISSLDKGLESEIHEGGKNFSVGQRQLLCLTRALLRNVRILLLDEATASLDERTDDVVRECLFESFKHCTVLIIAHRLSSISQSDKTLLMDGGKIIEFDDTKTLMEEPTSRVHKVFDMARKDLS